MHSKENREVSQIVRWIRKNMSIWDVISGDYGFDFTIGDCIDMLEQVTEEEMYPFALILIAKLGKCEYMDDAITNVIVHRINDPDPNTGIIMECINEFKMIANQKDIMKKDIETSTYH